MKYVFEGSYISEPPPNDQTVSPGNVWSSEKDIQVEPCPGADDGDMDTGFVETFADKDFKGKRNEYPTGLASQIANDSSLSGDKLTSIKNACHEVTLYQDKNFGGDTLVLPKGEYPRIGDYRSGWNDRTDSLGQCRKEVRKCVWNNIDENGIKNFERNSGKTPIYRDMVDTLCSDYKNAGEFMDLNDQTCYQYKNDTDLIKRLCSEGDNIHSNDRCNDRLKSRNIELHDEIFRKYCKNNPKDENCSCYNSINYVDVCTDKKTPINCSKACVDGYLALANCTTDCTDINKKLETNKCNVACKTLTTAGTACPTGYVRVNGMCTNLTIGKDKKFPGCEPTEAATSIITNYDPSSKLNMAKFSYCGTGMCVPRDIGNKFVPHDLDSCNFKPCDQTIRKRTILDSAGFILGCRNYAKRNKVKLPSSFDAAASERLLRAYQGQKQSEQTFKDTKTQQEAIKTKQTRNKQILIVVIVLMLLSLSMVGLVLLV